MNKFDDPIEEWKLNPDQKSSEAGFMAIHTYYDNGEYYYHAYFRWTGCVEIRKAYNDPFPKKNDEQGSMHFCDIDEAIKLLVSLKEFSEKYFKDDNLKD